MHVFPQKQCMHVLPLLLLLSSGVHGEVNEVFIVKLMKSKLEFYYYLLIYAPDFVYLVDSSEPLDYVGHLPPPMHCSTS